MAAYEVPGAGKFLRMYPEFKTMSSDSIEDALKQASRLVDSTWHADDYTTALMLYAAHVLARRQLAAETGGSSAEIAAESLGPVSVTYNNRASFDVATSKAFFRTTIYGIEFHALLRRNRGGPLVV